MATPVVAAIGTVSLGGIAILYQQWGKHQEYKKANETNKYRHYEVIEDLVTSEKQLTPSLTVGNDSRLRLDDGDTLVRQLKVSYGTEKVGTRSVPRKVGKQTIWVTEAYTYTDWREVKNSYEYVNELKIGEYRFPLTQETFSQIRWKIGGNSRSYKPIPVKGLLNSIDLFFPVATAIDEVWVSDWRLRNQSKNGALLEYQMYKPQLRAVGHPAAVRRIFRSKVGFFPSLVVGGTAMTVLPWLSLLL